MMRLVYFAYWFGLLIVGMFMLMIAPAFAFQGHCPCGATIVYHHREWPNYSYRERVCKRCYEPRVYSYERRRYDDDGWSRRDPDHESGIRCREPVRVVGEAHLTEKGAMDSAARQWSATVRYDLGERFMELENSRGYAWRCDRAGTNESTLGKIGEAITSGQGYQRRCMVIARPCMQAPKRGDRDDR